VDSAIVLFASKLTQWLSNTIEEIFGKIFVSGVFCEIILYQKKWTAKFQKFVI
jgi:hypothetical protein